MVAILINCSRGLRPRTSFMGLSAPHPDLLFSREKSRQKHAREEKPFRWGFSPVTPSSATTQRGAPAPLWKPPHNLQWKRLSGLAGPGENPKRGPQPPHWSLRGVVLRRGTQSKVSPSYACFWLLFSREKSDPGYGAGGPERFRKETCLPPARRWANLSASVPCVGSDYQ